jgi:hypothetical protein
VREQERRAEEQRRAKQAADEEWRRSQHEREIQRKLEEEAQEQEIKARGRDRGAWLSAWQSGWAACCCIAWNAVSVTAGQVRTSTCTVTLRCLPACLRARPPACLPAPFAALLLSLQVQEGERYQREMELLRKEQEEEKRRRQEAHDR